MGIVSDVYSLGVLVYELLVCVKFYWLICGMVVELEEFIMFVDLFVVSDVVLMLVLRKVLCGDFDVIFGKVFKKFVMDCYFSVDVFVLDLWCYLCGELVFVWFDSKVYRVVKFVGWYRLVVVMGVGVVVLLLVGGVVVVW